MQERAQRLMKRAIKINPSLVKKDTITVRDTITIEGFSATGTTGISVDTAAIDSVLNVISNDAEREIIKEYIIKYQYLTAEKTHNDSLYSLRIWIDNNGKIQHELNVHEKQQAIELQVETNNITVENFSFAHKVLKTLWAFFVEVWWLIALVIIFVIARKKLAKMFFK
jgi:hypothetical protein